MGDRQSLLFFGSRDGACCYVADRTQCDDGYVRTILQAASFAHGYLFQRAAPVEHYASSTRIADDERPFVGQLGGIHQAAQLVLVQWRGDGQVGDGAEVGQVEYAVVCGAVFAHQAGGRRSRAMSCITLS